MIFIMSQNIDKPYIIKIPSNNKRPDYCEDRCPFCDFGDSGYGEHCNLLDHKSFMSPKNKIFNKRYWKLREAIYAYIQKKYNYIHSLRKPGKKSWDKYAERYNKAKKLDMKLKIKLQKAENYWKKCPFYGRKFELKL